MHASCFDKMWSSFLKQKFMLNSGAAKKNDVKRQEIAPKIAVKTENLRFLPAKNLKHTSSYCNSALWCTSPLVAKSITLRRAQWSSQDFVKGE